MISQHNTFNHRNSPIETGVIKNTNGKKLMFRVRRVGSILKVNPPPDDLRCQICERKVSDLEPFDREFCELAKVAEEEIREFFAGPEYKVQTITPDHRLLM